MIDAEHNQEIAALARERNSLLKEQIRLLSEVVDLLSKQANSGNGPAVLPTPRPKPRY